MKKINIETLIVAVFVLMMILVFTYMTTIKEGWYMTYDHGVETHVFYKTDIFGNSWITESRSTVTFNW